MFSCVESCTCWIFRPDIIWTWSNPKESLKISEKNSWTQADYEMSISSFQRWNDFFWHHSGILCNFELNFSWPWNEFHSKFVANVLSVFSAGSSNALERSRDVSNCHCNFTALKWWKHKHLLATSGFLRRNPSLWPILRTTPSWLRYRDSLFYQMVKHLFFLEGILFSRA